MDRARLDSPDALRQMREAMLQFGQTVRAALNESDSELRRTRDWLEREQTAYWKHQLRVRGRALEEALAAVRAKQLPTHSRERPRPATEEQQAAIKAKRRVEEAREKLAAIRQWMGRIDRQAELYRAAVVGLRDAVEAGVPRAVGQLDRAEAAIQAYFAERAPDTARDLGPTGPDQLDSVARGGELEGDAEEVGVDPPAEEDDDEQETDG